VRSIDNTRIENRGASASGEGVAVVGAIANDAITQVEGVANEAMAAAGQAYGEPETGRVKPRRPSPLPSSSNLSSLCWPSDSSAPQWASCSGVVDAPSSNRRRLQRDNDQAGATCVRTCDPHLTACAKTYLKRILCFSDDDDPAGGCIVGDDLASHPDDGPGQVQSGGVSPHGSRESGGSAFLDGRAHGGRGKSAVLAPFVNRAQANVKRLRRNA
jgi:hypothetical protein